MSFKVVFPFSFTISKNKIGKADGGVTTRHCQENILTKLCQRGGKIVHSRLAMVENGLLMH